MCQQLYIQLCFILFSSFPFLLAFDVGGLGFEFCVFVAGRRHALRREWPFIISIIIQKVKIQHTILPLRCENAADAVFNTPHSCLTIPCPTHCSPVHANLCPTRMHRLIPGPIH